MNKFDTLTITHDLSGNKGRYKAHLNGFEGTAELTYSVVSNHLIIADNTAVPDSMRGLGVGKALVVRLIEDAQRMNIKIVPLCPGVNAPSVKRPEWSNVFQN